MNLYLLKRTNKNPMHDCWYDTYYGAVVAASTEEVARLIHPNQDKYPAWDGQPTEDWPTTPGEIVVRLLGTAAPGIGAGVIQTDFYEA